MSKIGRVLHGTSHVVLLERVRWCGSFFCKLRGLMFRRELAQGEGLLLAEPYASRAGTAIHMLFMAFPIATIWLDGEFNVVDKVYAKPWRLAYVPAKAARYTLEAHPTLLDMVQIGDKLLFEAQDD
jgi:uncharacterized membrane protein (UPF0127 family)